MWPITSVLVQVAPRESRKAFLLLYRKGSVGFPSNCILRGGWDLPDLWEVRYLIVFMLFRSFLCFTETPFIYLSRKDRWGVGVGGCGGLYLASWGRQPCCWAHSSLQSRAALLSGVLWQAAPTVVVRHHMRTGRSDARLRPRLEDTHVQSPERGLIHVFIMPQCCGEVP